MIDAAGANLRARLLVAALAFWAIRLLAGVQTVGTPLAVLHEWSATDMDSFVRMATRVADGDLLLRDPHRPHHDWMDAVGDAAFWETVYGHRHAFVYEPGWSWLLGAAMGFLGTGVASWLVLNALLSFGTMLLVFFLARRLGGERAALPAALLYALCGPLAMHELFPLREVALVALLFAASALAADGRRPFAAGLAAGLATVVKVISIVAVPFLVAALLRNPEARRRRGLLLGLGLTLPLAFLAARNLAVGAPLSSASSRGALAVFLGNHVAFPGILADTTNLEEKGRIFRGMVDRHGSSAGPVFVESVRSHGGAGRWLLFLGRRAGAMVSSYEPWDNVNWYFVRRLVAPLGALPGLLPLLLLALAGAPVLRNRPVEALALAAPVAVVAAHLLVTTVLGRYRLPLVPVLAVLGGAGFVALVDLARSGARVRAAATAVALLGLAWLLSRVDGPRTRPADAGVYRALLAAHPELRPHPGFEAAAAGSAPRGMP